MVIAGEDLLILVETAVAGVFVEISDLHQAQLQTSRDRTRYAVFQAPSHILSARAVRAITLQGYLNVGDVGQERARTMENTQTPVKLRVLPDGTNGLEMTVLIHSKAYESSAEVGTLQPIAFDCEVTTIPSNVGTGILI